jgi:hypothetical protein
MSCLGFSPRASSKGAPPALEVLGWLRLRCRSGFRFTARGLAPPQPSLGFRSCGAVPFSPPRGRQNIQNFAFRAGARGARIRDLRGEGFRRVVSFLKLAHTTRFREGVVFGLLLTPPPSPPPFPPFPPTVRQLPYRLGEGRGEGGAGARGGGGGLPFVGDVSLGFRRVCDRNGLGPPTASSPY